MKTPSVKILWALILLAALAVFAFPAFAQGTSVGTKISVEIIDDFKILSKTEDFTLGVGASQELRVSVGGASPFSYVWEVSKDSGASFQAALGAGNAASYTITNAARNLVGGVDTAYVYRVTVTNSAKRSISANIGVLVSDEYGYRTISLRNGDTDVSAYMHDSTRLVVTQLDEDSEEARDLEQIIAKNTLPLIICDVRLVNQNSSVAPYYGGLQLSFHVGEQYNGLMLNARQVSSGVVSTYSGIVTDGVLSVMVNELAPFVVEAPAYTAHMVNATAGEGGTVSPSGRVYAAEGESLVITFLPDEGYIVGEVLVDGAPVPVTGNSIVFSKLEKDKTLFVRFEKVAPIAVTHTLRIECGSNGAVSPSGVLNVLHGAAQTLYFYPASGYELDSVTVNGEPVSVIGSSYTLSAVIADTSVAATFRQAFTQPPDVYLTITAASGKGGSISPAGEAYVEYGGSLYYYFLADEGFALDTVYIDGVETETAGGMYRFANVTQAHTIRATFKASSPQPEERHTVSVKSKGRGSVSPSGDVVVAHGGSQTFYFIADEGYEVSAIYVNGALQSTVAKRFTLRNITDDTTLAVRFAPVEKPDAGLDCDCMWARAFGECAVCRWFGRCVNPWCVVVPVLAFLFHTVFFPLGR